MNRIAEATLCASLFLAACGAPSDQLPPSESTVSSEENIENRDTTIERLISNRMHENAYTCSGVDSLFFTLDVPQFIGFDKFRANFEVKNLELTAFPKELTQADKLNGMEYDVQVEFGENTAYRQRSFEQRGTRWGPWTEWRQPARLEFQPSEPSGMHNVSKTKGDWSYRVATGYDTDEWQLMEGLFRGAQATGVQLGPCDIGEPAIVLTQSPTEKLDELGAPAVAFRDVSAEYKASIGSTLEAKTRIDLFDSDPITWRERPQKRDNRLKRGEKVEILEVREGGPRTDWTASNAIEGIVGAREAFAFYGRCTTWRSGAVDSDCRHGYSLTRSAGITSDLLFQNSETWVLVRTSAGQEGWAIFGAKEHSAIEKWNGVAAQVDTVQRTFLESPLVWHFSITTEVDNRERLESDLIERFAKLKSLGLDLNEANVFEDALNFEFNVTAERVTMINGFRVLDALHSMGLDLEKESVCRGLVLGSLNQSSYANDEESWGKFVDWLEGLSQRVPTMTCAGSGMNLLSNFLETAARVQNWPTTQSRFAQGAQTLQRMGFSFTRAGTTWDGSQQTPLEALEAVPYVSDLAKRQVRDWISELE